MEPTQNIHSRIAAAQAEIGGITKGKKNPHFGHKYYDINALIAAVTPALHNNGLMLTQPIADGQVWTIVTEIETGEQVKASLPLPNAANPQAMGSALTYYRRYTLAGLLALPAEDDDGNAASAKPKKQKKEAPRDPAAQARAKVLVGQIKNAPEPVKAAMREKTQATPSWSFTDGHVWTVEAIAAAEAYFAQINTDEPVPTADQVHATYFPDTENEAGKLAPAKVEALIIAWNQGPGFTSPVDSLAGITDPAWLAAALAAK